MQPLITAKCQRAPLLPVRDELLLRRYFILNASCLNWSMHLGEVMFFAQSVCCPLPRGLRELPFCLSAFMGQEEGVPLPFQPLLVLSLPTSSPLGKRTKPRQLPRPPTQLPAQEVSPEPLPHPTPIPAAGCIQGQPRPCGLEKN